MSLKEYYERFCAEIMNPAFNLIEVEIKREIQGLAEQLMANTINVSINPSLNHSMAIGLSQHPNERSESAYSNAIIQGVSADGTILVNS